MNIGVLTSSRADFGIYLPLINALKKDDFFNFEVIAFGTHLSRFHDHTLDQIISEGFKVKYTIESMLLSDSEESIATAISLTISKFATFWREHSTEFDLVFCLGDRYEMFAAVIAGVPFQINFAHIHGGEKTLGAIDNIFRHSISHASKFHFTSTKMYADKLSKMLDEKNHIYPVGALSLENINQIKLLSIEEFQKKWNIDLNLPTILMTFHPETLHTERNEIYAKELIKVIMEKENYQYLITMPNADTSGSLIRNIFKNELHNSKNVFMIENLGTVSYFTAIKYCSFLLGNTSSGIIEAASFGKYVINLGDRQKGRLCSKNVLHSKINKNQILSKIKRLENAPIFLDKNIYWAGGAVQNIINILKNAELERSHSSI